MNMYRDKEGMMALDKAGLMIIAKGGQMGLAAVARVVDLIVNGPALPRPEQLSANGVDGKPFSLAALSR
jgi:blue copper oxidase